jgi:hypothetical protein
MPENFKLGHYPAARAEMAAALGLLATLGKVVRCAHPLVRGKRECVGQPATVESQVSKSARPGAPPVFPLSTLKDESCYNPLEMSPTRPFYVQMSSV